MSARENLILLDLHVLDLTQQRPRWHRVVVQGAGPGPRYGHVMALVGQRFLLAIGGNDGKCESLHGFKPRPTIPRRHAGEIGLKMSARDNLILLDLHVLDLTQQRPRWHRVVVQGAGPGPRYGHVMALVGQRFLLAIGGNDESMSAL
ncbi:serine/threonine-protein phosphatase BSL2 homolog isoform X2 [Nymphaea colorata]|uniref:serine/threonine-protein phosphatase BSL2 homolog isoform X2 n=1 Tax=Nymphaea colorata TaxID=210225 RepID=UPI00129E550D|nr:serine/threonine-protein phosphatase BSL2 homolog isoform X2 [Nymphaea colorata]XP_031501635.1 serine/threonine-protein phosphatase BSL2 homolog isoform X2 [Nymphaea colorata]